MKTIILDFTDGKVKILKHKQMQIEEVEDLMFEKYDLSPNNIQWMTVNDLIFEYLGEKEIGKAIFSIDKNEINDFAGKKLSKRELIEIFSFIENDEGIWNAIEKSKKEALNYISKK
ncbi:hypothetical protein M0P65_03905 [Candidatus Gracilibacteria bacterium]|nr:hypothetical protein [Candidatus Gracilibacteria bacterium]